MKWISSNDGKLHVPLIDHPVFFLDPDAEGEGLLIACYHVSLLMINDILISRDVTLLGNGIKDSELEWNRGSYDNEIRWLQENYVNLNAMNQLAMWIYDAPNDRLRPHFNAAWKELEMSLPQEIEQMVFQEYLSLLEAWLHGGTMLVQEDLQASLEKILKQAKENEDPQP